MKMGLALPQGDPIKRTDADKSKPAQRCIDDKKEQKQLPPLRPRFPPPLMLMLTTTLTPTPPRRSTTARRPISRRPKPRTRTPRADRGEEVEAEPGVEQQEEDEEGSGSGSGSEARWGTKTAAKAQAIAIRLKPAKLNCAPKADSPIHPPSTQRIIFIFQFHVQS
jgi:hypothetical protein